MQARRKHNLKDKELTYGEITFQSFWDILDSLDLKDNLTFYDVGCGTGKPVIVAALYDAFSSTIGYEIIPEIHSAAESIRNILIRTYPEIGYKVNFVLADALEQDIQNADVVFLPSTCFSQANMHLFAEKCTYMKKGSYIITLTKPLPGLAFELIQQKKYEMSWGATTVNIYRVAVGGLEPPTSRM